MEDRPPVSDTFLIGGALFVACIFICIRVIADTDTVSRVVSSWNSTAMLAAPAPATTQKCVDPNAVTEGVRTQCHPGCLYTVTVAMFNPRGQLEAQYVGTNKYPHGAVVYVSFGRASAPLPCKAGSAPGSLNDALVAGGVNDLNTIASGGFSSVVERPPLPDTGIIQSAPTTQPTSDVQTNWKNGIDRQTLQPLQGNQAIPSSYSYPGQPTISGPYNNTGVIPGAFDYQTICDSTGKCTDYQYIGANNFAKTTGLGDPGFVGPLQPTVSQLSGGSVQAGSDAPPGNGYYGGSNGQPPSPPPLKPVYTGPGAWDLYNAGSFTVPSQLDLTPNSELEPSASLQQTIPKAADLIPNTALEAPSVMTNIPKPADLVPNTELEAGNPGAGPAAPAAAQTAPAATLAPSGLPPGFNNIGSPNGPLNIVGPDGTVYHSYAEANQAFAGSLPGGGASAASQSKTNLSDYNSLRGGAQAAIQASVLPPTPIPNAQNSTFADSYCAFWRSMPINFSAGCTLTGRGN